MQQRVPTYMVVILVVTGIYLSVEIPFSIYLVSVMGGVAAESDINTVEKFGRVLTGVAVALAYVGLRTYPKYHEWGHSFRDSTKAAIFRMVPIVLLVFFGLHFYGEVRGMLSTGEQRKDAFIANLARRTIAEEGTQGIRPSLDPSWLATVSGLPALASSEKLVELSGRDLRELSRREALRTVGDARTASANFSTELEEKMTSAYSTFADGQARFQEAISSRDSTAEYEWESFRSRLRSHFGNSVPRPGTGYHSRVIKELRSEGLPVAKNFRLDDKASFKVAVMRKITAEASSRFQDAIVDSVGKGSKLKPTSTKDDFYRDPAVQRKIRETTGLTVASSVVIRPDMDLAAFERHVHPVMLSRATEKVYETATMYAPGFTSQVEREMGEGAFKAATLPATALLLSLAGALFHMYKFSGYLMLIFGRTVRSSILAYKPVTHAFAATVLVLAVIGMRGGLSEQHPLIENDGGIYGEIVTAAVGLQPGMFFIGEAMASTGPWQLIEKHLPASRHSEVALASAGEGAISEGETASLIPLPATKPADAEVAEADVEDFIVPIPTPRPR